MAYRLDRREFLAASACAALSARRTRGLHAQEGFKHTVHKALIVKTPDEQNLTPIKQAGFDGVEGGMMPPEEAAKARATAEKLGLRIHSVLRGWAEFNSSDAEKVEASLKTTADALRCAQAYGADAILLVPCRIGGKGMAMPEPWEFRVDFDEKNGHLRAVAEKENDRYQEYMRVHDLAYTLRRPPYGN